MFCLQLMILKIICKRPVISAYLRQSEPDAVEAPSRQHKTIEVERQPFLAVGPNEMWCLGQYDKFKRYGLFFHVGLDPYPGVIHWCKVWWTVRNPKLIAHFYLNAARENGGTHFNYLIWTSLYFYEGIPLITLSDLGAENYNVACAQTALRHCVDPSLNGTIQHQWSRDSEHGNIKPVIHWSVFSRHWSVGFQALLDRGVDEGYYDVEDPLESFVLPFFLIMKMLIVLSLVFRFVFIPFLQREVDAWVYQRNWTKRRADRNKVLPNGIPMLILKKPHKWNAADYKVYLHVLFTCIINDVTRLLSPPKPSTRWSNGLRLQMTLFSTWFLMHLLCVQMPYGQTWGLPSPSSLMRGRSIYTSVINYGALLGTVLSSSVFLLLPSPRKRP